VIYLATIRYVPADYPTITAAIAASNPYDTIRVAPGTYNEAVFINKTIQVLGAQAGVDARNRSNFGAESIIAGNNNSALVQLLNDNVVFDGFTVQGNSQGAGIYIPATFSGSWIFNNIVRDNVFGLYLNSSGATYSQVRNNYFDRNNLTGPASGNGIYSDQGLSNAIIDSNLFTGHVNTSILLLGPATPVSNVVISRNQIINDESLILSRTTNMKIVDNFLSGSPFSGIYIGGGNNRIEIEGNQILNNGTSGIRVTTAIDPAPNTNIRAKNNTIAGNTIAGLNIDAGAYTVSPRRLDATNNYWGSPTGPSGAGPDRRCGYRSRLSV
jgi:nitrous oxidase accessory protein NosD